MIYTFKGEFNIPLRYYFSKNVKGLQVNLHVVPKNHFFIRLNLCFRNYLRSNEKARVEYAELKQDLLQDPNAHEKVAGLFSKYNLGKDAFIKKVLQAAGFDDYCLNFCLHYNEMYEYERLREAGRVDEGEGEGEGEGRQPQDTSGTVTKNHKFVLYKGVQIAAIADVQICTKTNKKAALSRIIVDKNQQKGECSKHIINTLQQWAQLHGYRFEKHMV